MVSRRIGQLLRGSRFASLRAAAGAGLHAVCRRSAARRCRGVRLAARRSGRVQPRHGEIAPMSATTLERPPEGLQTTSPNKDWLRALELTSSLGKTPTRTLPVVIDELAE